jgi:hypothetical protein
MTAINWNEINKITYVDQALMWCVIELEHANHHADNYWLSDNASVRAEAKDYVSWQVIQGDNYQGQFTYTALLPIVNPHPLLEKHSLIECVQSYTLFSLPDEQITYPTGGKGLQLPSIPVYIDTLERLLVWLVQIVEAVNRFIKLTNAIIASKSALPEIPPTLDIGTDGGTPVINNIPSASTTAGDGSPATAEDAISQYENPTVDRNATPSWFQDALDNHHGESNSNGNSNASNSSEPTPVDPGIGNKDGTFDTLPVCKEQDPSITTFSKDGILNFVNKQASSKVQTHG